MSSAKALRHCCLLRPPATDHWAEIFRMFLFRSEHELNLRAAWRIFFWQLQQPSPPARPHPLDGLRLPIPPPIHEYWRPPLLCLMVMLWKMMPSVTLSHDPPIPRGRHHTKTNTILIHLISKKTSEGRHRQRQTDPCSSVMITEICIHAIRSSVYEETWRNPPTSHFLLLEWCHQASDGSVRRHH